MSSFRGFGSAINLVKWEITISAVQGVNGFALFMVSVALLVIGMPLIVIRSFCMFSQSFWECFWCTLLKT